jgi:chaperonin cofactor prefoldin
MKLIDDWLKSKRNFISGRSIYKVFGKDETLKKLFDKGETPFAKNKLAEVLQALNVTPVQVLTAEDISFTAMPESDDDVLQSLNVAWKEKYARMNLLRHNLDAYGDDNSKETIAACEPICREILELEKEINALWQQRDAYKETGQLPGVTTKKKELSTKLNEAANQLENIKKNIRRNKQQMQKFPAEPKYAQLFNDYLNQYKEITGEDYKERKK